MSGSSSRLDAAVASLPTAIGGTTGMQPEYEVVLRPGTRSLRATLVDFWRYRDLLTMLVWRDFVSKYKQTVLGPLWFIVQPVLMAGVFTVVFSTGFAMSTEAVPPMLFYLCGQIGWNYFAQTIAANASTFATHSAVFGKVYFPRIIVPVAVQVSHLVALGVQVATFAAFFVAFKYGGAAPNLTVGISLMALPLLIAHVVLLSLGVGLLLSAATAKYRDLTQVTTLLVQVWMYATPVIYPLSAIPQRWQWLAAINPMTPIMEGFRRALLGVGTPEPAQFAWSAGLTLVLLTTGIVAFDRVERTFIDTV